MGDFNNIGEFIQIKTWAGPLGIGCVLLLAMKSVHLLQKKKQKKTWAGFENFRLSRTWLLMRHRIPCPDSGSGGIGQKGTILVLLVSTQYCSISVRPVILLTEIEVLCHCSGSYTTIINS